ncbi:pimeloyl-ACP methyl ester carboxylesterase [Paenibacillus rhizosphaerae]|uniref:Pimeloyl-ACP methyl ester carboxylesterase n=1 Tax=Paenibacillus rhizosphaerae TaxID=297318 RepID=A0A839TNK7_9BACL|nr:alpha/beta hydrolase [Paenibacillus rhizosphaerae]MBB3128262.1 pimeloyl-ACP methyl ester carboxylesterase [Paenibacillus rhizosphaerae]
MFTHREVRVKEVPIHVVEAGTISKPTVFFIHGWPTCWLEFEGVMNRLAAEFHVVAIDIPGIGNSVVPLQSYSKRNIAEYVRGIMDHMNLQDVTLVGGDAGGQVTYAFLKSFPDRLSRAVIMNVSVPGVYPWNEVKSNPYVWHFALHNVPELPELLVSGKELPYFSYFYDVLAGKGKRMSDARRKLYVEAYSRLDALKAGFDLYRSFHQDEQDNAASKNVMVSTPILYLRGSDENADIEKYLAGFRENGLRHIQAKTIEHCGHFSAEEQPERVALAIKEYIAKP